MNESTNDATGRPVDLSTTAAQPTGASMAEEREAVGDQPDLGPVLETGDKPDEDHAQ